MSKHSHIRIRLLTAFAASTMVLSLVLVSGGRTGAHTGDWIDSTWTTSPPTIDGWMVTGEWADAASIDLGAIPENDFPAYLLVKNDANYLYIAYDAVGDETPDLYDCASVAFDTGHDAAESMGEESEFFWGPGANNGQEHLVNTGMNWSTEDSPFDTGLPDHVGLAGAFGYGPSDLGTPDHRIYELQIPLVLLQVAPADVIGFLGASEIAPGVMDASDGYDCWPVALTGPPSLVDYADLRMGRVPMAADLDINPPSQAGQAVPSSTTNYTITVINRGTTNDVFEMEVISVWATELFDSGGVNPIIDTDADLIPDTGSVGPGASFQIIARVSVPASGACDDALITGTSANDPSTSRTAIVRTCLMGGMLNPPHSDFGVDTDLPSNGLFDELWINVGVYIGVEGLHDVMIYLYDPSDMYFITSSDNFTYLLTGSHVVSVFLQGMSIYDSGYDGQYVAYIYLNDEYGNLLDSGIYVTSPYMHTDFDGPDALLNPPHSDYGVDTDFPPNGLFDELWINIGVMVGVEGFYGVTINLYDPSDVFLITSNWNSSYLLTGLQVVSIFLDGLAIYNGGYDGQYVAHVGLYDDFGNLLDTETYITSPYMHTDFDGLVALLNPPHSDFGVDLDSPPNGLFNELWINVGVMTTVSASYEVSVSLYDSSGAFFITSGTNFTFLAAGPQVVTVVLTGRNIYDNGFDGAYEAAIDLYDDMMNFLDFGFYTTSYYLHTDFDGGSAAFNPPHSDYGRDTDVPPNGLYDELVIAASVTASMTGIYEISAPLYDQFMNYITSASTSVYLDLGNQAVPLAFPGVQIFTSGLDGPYTAILTISDLNGTIDADVHVTGAYSHNDFDPPAGEFAPPHSDHGLELTVPPDGLYEFLELDIMVNVTEAATFTIGVDLYDSTGTIGILSADAVAALGVGVHMVPVRLDGATIRSSGINGPYEADLSLTMTFSLLDSDVHMTQAYLHSDFAPIGAAFEPPYSDRVVDADLPPDGLADFLLVDVNINVTISGSYLAEALLMTPGVTLIDFIMERHSLSVGVSKVTLSFDGHRIVESGSDGPYEVLMELYDEYDRMIDFDVYTTAAYGVNQFEPLDVTPPVSTVGSMSCWKNEIPVLVPFSAVDSSPTDGLDSVTLYYRYSTDNSSWGSWTPFVSRFVGGTTAVGTMPFTFPLGTGYYEFQTTSVDVAGNQEMFGPPEGQVAYLPIAELRLQPNPLPLTAGQQRTLAISLLSTDGQPAILEAPKVVNLDTWSPSGEYRAISGSTAITDVTIAAGSSSVSVDYYDTAVGTWTLLGYTGDGFGGMGTANVIPASVASVAVDPGAITVEVAQTQTFTAVVEDAYGNRIAGAGVIWDVGSSLGTVDAAGRFTAGTAVRSGTITARIDSIQGFANIILTPGPAASIDVTPESATIQSGTKVTIIAEIADAYGNVINAAPVTWTVSGPGTINPDSGVTTMVTANSAGTISVTASLASLSATATFISVDTGGGLSSIAIVGIAGGLIGGILIGFAVGWMIHKRKSKPQPSDQKTAPPPPQANLPSATPPTQPPVQPPSPPPS